MLRLRLVNKPAALKADRTVNFTLFAMPNQPMPANYRRLVWDGGEGDPHRDRS